MKNKILKRFLLGVLAIGGISAANLVKVKADSLDFASDAVEITNGEDFANAINNAEDGLFIRLMNDISFSETIIVPEDCFVTVDMNNHTIFYTSDEANNIGAELTSTIMLQNGTWSGTFDTDDYASGTIILNNFKQILPDGEDDLNKEGNDCNAKGVIFAGQTKMWIVNGCEIHRIDTEKGSINPGATSLNPWESEHKDSSIKEENIARKQPYNFENPAPAIVGSKSTWEVKATLNEDFTRAQEGGETYSKVILLKDAELTENATLDAADKTFDLAGHTLTLGDYSLSVTNNTGNNIVRNGNIVGNIDFSTGTGDVEISRLSMSGNITNNAHAITVNGGHYGAITTNTGKINLEDGYFSGTYTGNRYTVLGGYYVNQPIDTQLFLGSEVANCSVIEKSITYNYKVFDTQPTKDNDYTVALNDTIEGASFQWYKEGVSFTLLDESYFIDSGYCSISEGVIQSPIDEYELVLEFDSEKVSEGTTIYFKSDLPVEIYDEEIGELIDLGEGNYSYTVYDYYHTLFFGLMAKGAFTLSNVSYASVAFTQIDGETNARLSDSTLGNAEYYCKIYKDGVLVRTSNTIKPNAISFVCGIEGATGDNPETLYQLDGRTITLPSNPYSKDGYKFVGWSDGENIISGSTYEVTNNITLTAKFTDDTGYDVTYELNGGSMSSDTTVSGVTEIPATLPTPTKSNYAFAGWFLDETFKNAAVAGFSITENTTLYAKWLDWNQITSKVATISPIEGLEEDTVLAIADNMFPSPTGFEVVIYASGIDDGFTYYDGIMWSDGIWTNEASGLDIEMIKEYIVENNVDFYVIGTFTEESVYSITYETNGGNEIEATTGAKIPATLPIPTKTGFAFAGWYTDEELENKATPGASISENTTLYAKWLDFSLCTSKVVDITAVSNLTTTDAIEIAKNMDDSIENLYLIVYKSYLVGDTKYYDLAWKSDDAGWTTSPTQVELDYIKTLMSDYNYDIYVIGTFEESVTITYNANGASGTMDDSIIAKGSFELPEPTFTAEEGKVFAGWSKNTNPTVSNRINADTLDITGDTTLYAVWVDELNTYKVDKTNKTITMNLNIPTTAGVNAVIPSATKLTQVGLNRVYTITVENAQWAYVSPGSSGSIYNGKEYHSTASSEVFVALEEYGFITIIVDTNKYAYDYSGFTFIINGKTYSNPGDGEGDGGVNRAPFVVVDLGILTNYGDLAGGDFSTVYTITYETNGGNEMDMNFGTSLPSELLPAVKDNYRFLGWYYDNETFNKKANEGDEISGNVILYAKWEEATQFVLDDKINITFDAPVYNTDVSNYDDNTKYVISVDNGLTIDKVSFGCLDTGKMVDSLSPFGTYVAFIGLTKDKDYFTEIENSNFVITGGTLFSFMIGYNINYVKGSCKKADGSYNEHYNNIYLCVMIQFEVNGYEVTYELNGGSMSSDTSVNGVLALPDTLPIPTKANHTFGGWFLDETFNNAAVAGSAITDNTTLYAKWTEFGTLSDDTEDVDSTYDKTNKATLANIRNAINITGFKGTDTLDTSLIKEEYKFSEDGTYVEASNINWENINAINANTYTVYYRYTFDVYYTIEDSFDIKINPVKVDIPEQDSSDFTYDTTEQTYLIKESSLYTISNNKQTNVGLYTVVVSLKDMTNYIWNDGTNNDRSYTFAIKKGDSVITVDTTTITKTYGETIILPEATSTFGTVTCDKKAADLVNAGTYTVTYTVEGTTNYNGDTKTLTVVIEKADSMITVDTTTITKIYGETIILPKASSNFGTVTCDKKAADLVNVGTYTVTYTVEGTTNYNGDTKTLTVVIKTKSIDNIPEGETKPIVIIENQDGFDPNMVIEVKVEVVAGKVEEGSTLTIDYNTLLNKNEKLSGVYDVKLLLNGVEIPVSYLGDNATITVKMLVPNELVGKTFRIVHVHDASDVVEIKLGTEEAVGTYIIDDNGYLVTKIDKLSEFAFIYEENNNESKTVGTVCIIVGSILLLLLLIYFLGYIFLYRRGHLDDSVIRVIYKWLPRGNKNRKEDSKENKEESNE